MLKAHGQEKGWLRPMDLVPIAGKLIGIVLFVVLVYNYANLLYETCIKGH